MNFLCGNTSGYNYHAGMSNRACAAYDYGAMPKSKWTKSAIIDAVLSENEHLTENDLKKLTKKQLFDLFIAYDSWHHTSFAYNETNFYTVRDDVAEITKDMLPARETQKKEKDATPNLFITAKVSFKISEKGRRGSWHSKVVSDVVNYRSHDKIVNTRYGNKRISSLYIEKKIEQKTKFASKEKLK